MHASYNITTSIVLWGWIPAVLLVFTCLPPRRAVIASFLFAWLFLPMAAIKLAQGIPVYSKMTATSYGVLLGVLVFDLRRLLGFRPRWTDLPMAVWCLCPFMSSVTNHLGVYDGLSATLSQSLMWGVPYFIGRVYFTNPEELRELAVGMMIGGLVYVPLCLFEMRMSPQLHFWVYGFYQHVFDQTMRWGGYRPMVFMQHGLMVGMWMVNTALVAIWLWATGSVKRLWGVPMFVCVTALAVTAVLCKSTGALAFMALGLAVLFAARLVRSRIPLLVLLALAPLYMTLRTTGIWDGKGMTDWVAANVSQERAISLEGRMKQETEVTAIALQKPWFGWGSKQQGQDQLWLLVFRNQGGVALVCMSAVMLLPLALVLIRCPGGRIGGADWSPALALATVLVLYLLDCLFNGMVNPIFMLAGGAVTGASAAVETRTKRPLGRRVVAAGA